MAHVGRAKSYLELVAKCDSFPHIDISQTPYAESPHTAFYQFLLPGDTRPHGFMLPSVVEKMPWTADFNVSKAEGRPRTVQLLDSSNGTDTSRACNEALRKVIHAAVDAKVFQALSKPHNEDFRIIGANYPVQMQRSAAPLFGIANRGAHMTMFVRVPEGLRIWVPRRSAHLKHYPGMLDTTVAGGVRAEESPFECIIHESDEEASLPEELIKTKARACGVITYVVEAGEGAGTEPGLMASDCIYVYDLEVGEDVVPRPRDDEVEAFYLWDVERVKAALVREEFKPNCALVMIDFFIRHGILTEDNEDDYLEIVTRMHRALSVPTAPSKGSSFD